MTAISAVTIRRARRDDVGVIVGMLADDPLGSARERLEDPLPPSYFRAFEALDRDPNIQLVVAEDGDGAVVGCLQLCILPGLSSQGASRALIEDVRVATHCRSRGIGEQTGAMGGRGSARQGLQAGRAVHAPHPRRRAAVLRAAGISAEPCRDDLAILRQPACQAGIVSAAIGCACDHCETRFCDSFRLTRDKLTSAP